MARPPIPDPEKRLNVGLRLHPVTLQQLDEVVLFFQELRRANPLLPFSYPESRTDVIEFLLRDGIRDVIHHALAWDRLQSPSEKASDREFMNSTPFWNTLLTEVRHYQKAIPESWRELEWPPRAAASSTVAPSDTAEPAATPAASVKRSRKPRKP